MPNGTGLSYVEDNTALMYKKIQKYNKEIIEIMNKIIIWEERLKLSYYQNQKDIAITKINSLQDSLYTCIIDNNDIKIKYAELNEGYDKLQDFYPERHLYETLEKQADIIKNLKKTVIKLTSLLPDKE